MKPAVRIELNNAPTGAQLSNPQARVIDPVLSTAARGYRSDEFIHRVLFPRVESAARGGTRIEFDRTDWRRVHSRRGPGANTTRVQFGHEGARFAVNQHRLLGQQPLEPAQEAQVVAGIDMNMRTVDGTQKLIEREKEIDAAEVATATSSYDATHVSTPTAANRWDADTSSPQAQVLEGVEIIRQAIGQRPNVAVIGGKLYSKYRKHREVKDSIQYKGGDAKRIASADDIAALWDLPKVVVGDAVYMNDAGATVDIWGNHCILGFTAVGSISRFEPSFAYCYQLLGTPFVEEPWFDRDSNSWLYPICDEYSQEIVGKDAGYLIHNAIV